MRRWRVFWNAEGGGGAAGGDAGAKGEGAGKGAEGDAGAKGAGPAGGQGGGPLGRDGQAAGGDLEVLRREAAEAAVLRAKLAEREKKLGELESRAARESALEEAIKKAAGEGVQVDREKARSFVLRVSGEDAAAIATEAVGLFGVKGAGQQRAMQGQPSNGTGSGKDAKQWTARELAVLRREDPQAYEAVVTERRRGHRFVG